MNTNLVYKKINNVDEIDILEFIKAIQSNP